MSSSIIAFSYLANLLAKIHQARIVAYSPSHKNMVTQLTNRKVNGIYRSFNVSDFIYHELTTVQSKEVERLFKEIVLSLKTKRDVEDLKVEGVWIGDLLYDSHCLNYQVPTISLTDQRFHESLKSAVSSYVFWRDYLRTAMSSLSLSATRYMLRRE